MSETHQLITAVATAIGCLAVCGGAIKYLLCQVRSLREEIAAMDEKKIDKDMCMLQHKQIIQDLEDGREKFRILLTKNTEVAADVNRLTLQLALIIQRLELSLPKIEHAAGLMPQLANDGR
jgi:hypothetical protein